MTRQSDLMRNQVRPSVFGVELSRATLTPLRTLVRVDLPGDYGASPMGAGMFQMVPSGDVVSYDERCSRLASRNTARRK